MAHLQLKRILEVLLKEEGGRAQLPALELSQRIQRLLAEQLACGRCAYYGVCYLTTVLILQSLT